MTSIILYYLIGIIIAVILKSLYGAIKKKDEQPVLIYILFVCTLFTILWVKILASGGKADETIIKVIPVLFILASLSLFIWFYAKRTWLIALIIATVLIVPSIKLGIIYQEQTQTLYDNNHIVPNNLRNPIYRN